MAVHFDTTRPDPGRAGPNKPLTDHTRQLKISVGVLAVVSLVLASVLVIGVAGDNGSAVPDDVNQVIDDYITAWETQDVEGFRAVATEDFSLTEEIYELDGTDHPMNADATFAARGVEETDYEVEFVGDMVVTGDGPWFVSVGENWIEQFSRLDGIAHYVIVDDAGTLKIANHDWIGVRSPILPDFDA